MRRFSLRDAYGETLVELGRENPNIVVLDADLSGSTKTLKFAKVFPERFFNVGVAETNMMNVAAGLAISGNVSSTISGAKDIALPMFFKFLLPFEVISVLLLIATIGAVAIGRRES